MKWNKDAYLYQSRTWNHDIGDSLQYTRQMSFEDRVNHFFEVVVPVAFAVLLPLVTGLLWAAEVI